MTRLATSVWLTLAACGGGGELEGGDAGTTEEVDAPEGGDAEVVPACGDLVGWYRFDDPGTTVTDSSGCENHGVSMGVPMQDEGGTGLSARFEGGTYIEVPRSPSLDELNALHEVTITAVVRYDQVAGPVHRAIVGLGNGMDGDAFVFHTYVNPVLGITAGSGTCIGMTTFPDGSGAYLATDWTHVAVRFDIASGTIAFFHDGTMTISETRPNYARPSFCTTPEPMLIGAINTTGGWSWLGAIDELKLYRRSLTNAEICADAGGTLAGTICEQP